MKTKLIFLLMFLTFACQLPSKEKIISINDYRNSEAPETDLSNYNDKDLKIDRISLDTIEGYTFYTYSKIENELEQNFGFLVISSKDFDKAAYKWTNDSICLIRMINSSSSLTESYSLKYHGGGSISLGLVDEEKIKF